MFDDVISKTFLVAVLASIMAVPSWTIISWIARQLFKWASNVFPRLFKKWRGLIFKKIRLEIRVIATIDSAMMLYRERINNLRWLEISFHMFTVLFSVTFIMMTTSVSDRINPSNLKIILTSILMCMFLILLLIFSIHYYVEWCKFVLRQGMLVRLRHEIRLRARRMRTKRLSLPSVFD